MFEFSTTLIALTFVSMVSGHGRLIHPPSRSSMWRREYGNYDTEKNYNDNQLFCGGRGGLSKNNGKCGVCGDPFDEVVRDNEAGGKYAKGIIVAQYTTDQVIDATVELTANHKGYFEFRLCKNDNVKKAITHDCLNKHLLVIAKAPKGGNKTLTRYYIPKSNQKYKFKLRLPQGLTCTQCVLQWKYHTGNDWNCDENKECCVGCGLQEEFYGCSDVAIRSNDQSGGATILATKSTTSTTIATATMKVTSAALKSTTPKVIEAAKTTFPKEKPTTTKKGDVLTTKSVTTSVQPQTTTRQTTTTQTKTTFPPKQVTVCSGVGVWRNILGGWCDSNCKHTPSYCPSTHCLCTVVSIIT